MTNKYHRQGYRLGGILKLGKKLFAKTAPERKDQLLDEIKKKRINRRNKRSGGKEKILNVRYPDGKIKKMKDQSKIMDVDTYSSVSSAPDKEVKAWLKHKGFKE